MYKYTDPAIRINTKDFIQKGKKIILLTLIIFHEIINPPIIDKGNKNIIPTIIRFEFSLIL